MSKAPVQHAIVLGVPRSGTTFLMRFLDALPDAECVSGDLLPAGITHLAGQSLPNNIHAALEHSFGCSLADYMTTSAYLSRWAAMRKWWTTGHKIRGLRFAAAGIRTECMLVYREPFLAFSPQLAYNAVPTARIIYIYRDGRDVADSLVRTYDVLTDLKLQSLETNEALFGRKVDDRYVPWWVPVSEESEFLGATPYVRAIWMWRHMVAGCGAFFSRPDVVASGRVLHVRYEDLVTDPLEEGHTILSHLGVKMTPRVRQHLKAAHPRSIGIHGRHCKATIREAERIAACELERLDYCTEMKGL